MVWNLEPEPAADPTPLRPVPDLRGLPVDDTDGRPAGSVYGTLVEAENGIVRYLDIRLAGSDKHVLVPIGHARIEQLAGRPRVRLRAAFREDLEGIPEFEPDRPLDPEHEREVLAAHGRSFYGERYYAHPAYDHSGLYAGEHPIIRGGPPPTRPLPLSPLSDLPDYRVAHDQPDVRGWPLVTSDSRTVGTVSELIVDPGEGKVRYVVVDRDSSTPALLPVGYLSIDSPGRQVIARGLTASDVHALPDFEGRLNRVAEDTLREALEARLVGGRRFGRPDFNGWSQ
ncbi:MAG TPA: PRC-barrel domain-containing protein [Longimicrobiales bacterium]|nr:PRC-barrel domain-containing protein [Longimicrobiales bacterium]